MLGLCYFCYYSLFIIQIFTRIILGRESHASARPLFDTKAFITREHQRTVCVSVFPGGECVPLREANTVNTDQGNWTPLSQTATCPPPASEEPAPQSTPTIPAGCLSLPIQTQQRL